jgi:hypothetical protein
MIYHARKIYNNCVSVRDYVIRQCLLNNDGLVIEFSGEKMFLDIPDLRDAWQQLTKKSFNSKFRPQKYELFDFPWRPNTQSLFTDLEEKQKAERDLERMEMNDQFN